MKERKRKGVITDLPNDCMEILWRDSKGQLWGKRAKLKKSNVIYMSLQLLYGQIRRWVKEGYLVSSEAHNILVALGKSISEYDK